MKKFLILLITVGIIIGIIAGLHTEEKKSTENINYTDKSTENNNYTSNELILSISEIDTLNPLKTYNSHVAYILNLIYEPLVTYDYENGISNILVNEVSKKNNTTWLIKLRDNILWHDGKKCTTSDVEFSINTIKDDRISSPYKSNVENISYIDIVDENTLVISLSKEDPYFISKLTFPIISKSYFEDNIFISDEKSNIPIGTGPYKYFDSDDESIKLKYNNEWWNASNQGLESLIVKKYSTYNESIKAFKSSEIDIIFTNMHEWKEKFGFLGINSYNFESDSYDLLIVNNKKGAFANSNIRKAIAHAINVNSIVHNIYNDNATISSLPLKSKSKYKFSNYEYDIDKAKQYYLESGINKKINCTLFVLQGDSEKIRVAQYIKEDLLEIGINVTIKEQSRDNYINNLKSGNFDIVLATIDMKNEYQMQNLVKSGDENNYSLYESLEMSEIINKLENSEEDIYDNNMNEFINQYCKDLPYIGLYFENNTILTNKSVKGEYKSTAYNPYNNIMNFYK